MPAIHNEDEFFALPQVHTLQKGDILIKKIFGPGHGMVAGAIVKFQQWRANRNPMMQQGHESSEHVALALDAFHVAEAVGPGVVVNSMGGEDRPETMYIVYRCGNQAIREGAADLAEGFGRGLHRTHQPQGKEKGGSYTVAGAGASLFRDPHLSQRANDLLNQMIAYYLGLSNNRPAAFCSMFVCACYEAVIRGSYLPNMPEYQYALQVDPYAMSPREYEGRLVSKPNHYHLAGWYIENFSENTQQNKLFLDISNAVLEYERSTKGTFRRPSGESLNALNKLRHQIDACKHEENPGHRQYRMEELYLMVIYYLRMLDQMPEGSFSHQERQDMLQRYGAPLTPGSTFDKLLRQHVELTRLHWA